MTLAELLRKRREAAGLRMASLARKAGLCGNWVSKIESGSLPSEGTVESLEGVLGITNNELQIALAEQRGYVQVRVNKRDLSAPLLIKLNSLLPSKAKKVAKAIRDA